MNDLVKLDEKGWEVLDDTPVAIPARYLSAQGEAERIRNLIRYELVRAAHEAGMEDFDEADDFDVGDDYDPTSPYEEQFDPVTGRSNWDMSPEATPPPPPNQPAPEPGKEGSQAPAPQGDAHNQTEMPV